MLRPRTWIAVTLALGTLSSCGLLKRTQPMESPARPELQAALTALGAEWDDALSDGWHRDIAPLLDSVDYRARGTVQGQWGGRNFRGSLDLRLRLESPSNSRPDEQPPQVWLKVKDPILGMPLAQGQILTSGITLFSPVMRRTWHVPAERATQHAIPLGLADLQRALLAHPVAFPMDFMRLNMDATIDTWDFSFRHITDGREADVILRFSKQAPHTLLSQSVSSEGMRVDISYSPGEMLLTLTEEASSAVKGQLTFSIRSTQTDRQQDFPFIVPSGYAREEL